MGTLLPYRSDWDTRLREASVGALRVLVSSAAATNPTPQPMAASLQPKPRLEAYALISHESQGHHDTELTAFLHRDEQVPERGSSSAT